MSEPCPDVVDDISTGCLDRDWLEDYIYSVLDDIIDATNIHLAAEDETELDYIVRPWALAQPESCFGTEEVDRIETFLTDTLATERVPKYMYQLGDAPARFPDPTTAAEVQVWEDCEGYWLSLADVRACMELDPNQILSEADCAEYGVLNSFYKILKCLAEGKCYSGCLCPECVYDQGCVCYTEISYDTESETWSPADLSNLTWECKEKTGGFAGEPLNAWISDGLDGTTCSWHRWSTDCEEI